jgi:cell wall-associated NlpC family hydrolase
VRRRWVLRGALTSVPVVAAGAGALLLGLAGIYVVAGPGTGLGSSPCSPLGLNPALLSAGAGTVTGLDGEQLRSAGTIVAVGRRLGVSDRGLVIALATASQESDLHNLTYGDRDSLGLFQQRAAWGSAAERTDPVASSQMFFTGGHQGQPGLLDITGWQSLPVTAVAQAVQRSAFPTAYAQWEPRATAIVGLTAQSGTNGAAVQQASLVVAGGNGWCSGGEAASAIGASVVAAARQWLGTPYSWGGGGLTGPTQGFGRGASTVGFDCSSLARYAWYHATGGAVLLPRVTTDQAATGRLLPPGSPLAPGDLMFFHDPADPPTVYHHVGIYAGAGAMVHAPRTGAFVETVPNVLDNGYFKAQFVGALRPMPAA